MKELISDICTFLEQGQELVLATICNHSGSTRVSTGGQDGHPARRQHCRQRWRRLRRRPDHEGRAEIFQNKCGRIHYFNLTGKDAAATDMICGGELKSFCRIRGSGQEALVVFQEASQALNSGKSATLITDVSQLEASDPEAPWDWKRWVMIEGQIPASLAAPSEEIVSHGARQLPPSAGRGPFWMWSGPVCCSKTCWCLAPSIWPERACFTQATASLASNVGFLTVVLDDREEFANTERFPEADKVVVLESFERCFDDFSIDADCYLVVITRGHLHDKTVLRQALQTRAGYVGMIGSRTKRDALYRDLLDKGRHTGGSRPCLQSIGISIGADTPEEIAVSIVGELIKARAQRRAPGGKH